MGKWSTTIVTLLVMAASYFLWDKLLEGWYRGYVTPEGGSPGLVQEYAGYVIPTLIGLVSAWIIIRRLKAPE